MFVFQQQLTSRIAILFFALAFWFAANRYIGIDHDARLYVLMALHWLEPAPYALDPWFAFGSQDQWSFFSPFLALLLRFFGVAHGAMAATLAQAFLFALAAIRLGRCLLRGSAAHLAGLVAVSIPILYSPRGMLFLTEGFVTARGFSVPLSLLGLTFALQKRRLLALLLCCLALVIHPIMAFAPSAVAVLLLVPRRFRWQLMVCGWAAAVVIFAVAVSGYLPTVDLEWFRFTYPAFLVFIDQWFLHELPGYSIWIGGLLAACFFSAPPRRRMYGMVLLVAGTCVAVSYLASSIPVLIILRAQFWRAMWLLKLLALVAIVDLVLMHVVRSRSRNRRAKLLVLLGGTNLTIALPWLAFSGVFLVSLIPQRVWNRLMVEVEKFPKVLMMGSAAMAVLLLPHYLYGLTSSGFFMGEEGQELVLGALRTGGLGGFAVIAWLLVIRVDQRAALLMAAITLIFTGSLWDSRSDQQKVREANYRFPSDTPAESRVVPQGRVVYWHGNPEQIWFVLGTSGYASTTHATGLIFSRERTFLLAERLKRVVMAGNSDWREQDKNADVRLSAPSVGGRLSFETDVLASYERAAYGIETREAIIDLCMDINLDYVVSRGKFEFQEGPMRESNEIVDSGKRFYLYRCHSIA